MIHPMWLGIFYGLSEASISLFLRAKDNSGDADRGSLRLIWRVIGTSLTSATLAAIFLRFAYFGGSNALYWTGFALFVFGIALRWYSIAYLGRFFTVNVVVAADQHVIDTGPYRFIRHPSYSGALLAFLGFGLCLANYLALLLILIPIGAVFLYRIRIEEAALQTGLGAAYVNYMQRTKRLVPFIY
jgi:protein-S-isoprenylcysteine O-methyltransferase